VTHTWATWGEEDGAQNLKRIKKILSELIESEEKHIPLSDEILTDMLQQKGIILQEERLQNIESSCIFLLHVYEKNYNIHDNNYDHFNASHPSLFGTGCILCTTSAIYTNLHFFITHDAFPV
jgi:hypothetical protein